MTQTENKQKSNFQIAREIRSTNKAIVDIFVAMEKFQKHIDNSNAFSKIDSMKARITEFMEDFDDGETTIEKAED